MTKDEFIALVEGAEINEAVRFPESFPLEYVRFGKTTDADGDEYTWIARTREHGYSQPVRSMWMVTTWKTLKGAKRNFIKRWGRGLEGAK